MSISEYNKLRSNYDNLIPVEQNLYYFCSSCWHKLRTRTNKKTADTVTL